MLAKLSTITTLYRKFTKNQVLTEGHLNEIVDYFDDQDRISRIGLSGVGIICGFQVSYNESSKNISITQGSGITTDGDLIHLYNTIPNGEKVIDFESKQYTHYKVHDNKKAAYKPYFYNGSDQLEIFELLTYEQQVLDSANTFPIEFLKENTGLDLTDAVTLLYIETYEKEADLCVSLSCDNQGLEIIGNHKALLVSKAIAEQIKSHDIIFNAVNFANLYYNLPSVISNRIVLHPENFINYTEIKKTFTNGIFKNNVIKKLHEGFEILLKSLQMPEILNSIQKNLAELFDFDENNIPPDFQYRYDLLNDLIDTYNEIKNLLAHMDGEFCCPDLKSFPKHLMLGEIVKTKPYFEYRHGFYKSPLLTGQNLSTANDCLPFDLFNEPVKEEEVYEFIIDPEGKEIKICYGKNTHLQQLYSLIKRAVQLLANYNVNFNDIKITPSFELGSLSKKAIPFYNNVGNHLIELWDYEKTAIAKQYSNRSYHDQYLNTKQPLEFISDHDFYRIEGHHGKNYKEALKMIQEIKRQHGLGFNVVVLGVTEYEAKEVMENFTSYYLNKNHGYEHKAGVAPGGTFIMIYIEDEYRSYPYYYSEGNSLAGDFESEGSKEEAIVYNPIIADFTLPYLCCDDNVISLSLPVDKLCFDEKTSYYPFHVTPTGGYVKADISEYLNGGVTKNEYGEFVFDPKLVSEELIGQPITFTVNNIETKCQVTIFRKPKFDFTTVITPSEESNEVTVDFIITSDNQDKIQYVWDFGDQSGIIITTETKIQHTYTYESPVEDSYSFPVKVVGDNGNCSYTVNHSVTFEIADIKVSIDVNNVCRNDDTPYVFTIESKGKKVILSGDGVSFDEDTKQYVFIGYDVPPEVNKVVVYVNGKPSDIVIKMLNLPIAKFDYTIENDNLTLINNSEDAVKYVWEIAGVVFETESTEPLISSISKYESASIQVTLYAYSKYCGEDTDGPRDIPLIERIPIDNCTKSVNTFIKKTKLMFKEIDSLPELEKFGKDTIFIKTEVEKQIQNVAEKTTAYINGEFNHLLVEMFTDSLYSKVLVATDTTINSEKIALSSLTESHIELFYFILKCQQTKNIKEFTDQIKSVLDRINALLVSLKKVKYNTDPKGTLKIFLSDMKVVFNDVTFIVDEINKQINYLS
ncbi:PKD domain-containing protein [Flavobacterium pectinovorum]|uniref:PKD domain-containing protein n=1 Tax=Flavobacterium pectinovorum TaxID=29533 RepID=A0AB36P350_9FLAO|nr:PKD domain-containing protein [Flavobacterium pectinovorum]OXB06241.1 hypothetical protein B0A72_09645 [Flavobacterium pectinovorum]SHM99027.1 PKD domain-containing protein [Flavobacterium pectinovorum]